MRVDREVQAPRQPVRERQPIAVEEKKARVEKPQERPPERPKLEGSVGRNLDTQA